MRGTGIRPKWSKALHWQQNMPTRTAKLVVKTAQSKTQYSMIDITTLYYAEDMFLGWYTPWDTTRDRVGHKECVGTHLGLGVINQGALALQFNGGNP